MIRRLEDIEGVCKDIRREYPTVPWRRIVGLRNVVVHHYFGVDLSVVWVIVSSQLEELKEEIEKIIETEC
ncbi:HepT-like ribonuclease domain-containing protein [Thermococcus pacificus]|nr:HepT-like ribonuclease domain-containing protein [Thermococcus pacificus]